MTTLAETTVTGSHKRKDRSHGNFPPFMTLLHRRSKSRRRQKLLLNQITSKENSIFTKKEGWLNGPRPKSFLFGLCFRDEKWVIDAEEFMFCPVDRTNEFSQYIIAKSRAFFTGLKMLHIHRKISDNKSNDRCTSSRNTRA